MSVERRATRRSTAENRIGSDESENLGIKESIHNISPKKLSEVTTLKEIVAEDENPKAIGDIDGLAASTEEGNGVLADFTKDEEVDEVPEEDEGAPEPKIAKLSDDLEEANGNGDADADADADAEEPVSKVRTKKEKVTFQCPECDRKFQKKHILTKHIKSHSVPRPFLCDFEDCDRSFANMKNLLKHASSVHQKGDEGCLHLCQFCQRGFITRAEMESHAETHLNEYKMYACRYCGKTFNKKFAMKIAIQACQEKGVDPCPYCNKGIHAKAYSDN